MRYKILTVDDSKTVRIIVRKAFKTYDCEILEAGNGVEGLAVAAKETPDLILLDVTMPVMDGVEMLTKLKADPALKAIPVMMLTAEGGRDHVLKIAKIGVRDYLVKPFKEELIIERVGRIVDLKPKGVTNAKAKRFDDPLTVLVVDDKPAISDQIIHGLADTPWSVQGRSTAGEGLDYCNKSVPDVVIVSLNLPDNAAFTFFQMLRAQPKTKSVPVFAMCVKTASDEQARAQQSGFTGIITKPIDFDEVKSRIARSLNLDTSYKYFEHRDGVLWIKLPANFGTAVANEVTGQLRPKIAEAVDAGLGKVVFDLALLKTADVTLIKLGLEVLQFCHEMSLRSRMVGSGTVAQECRKFEETKDWAFAPTFEEAVAALNGKEAVPA